MLSKLQRHVGSTILPLFSRFVRYETNFFQRLNHLPVTVCQRVLFGVKFQMRHRFLLNWLENVWSQADQVFDRFFIFCPIGFSFQSWDQIWFYDLISRLTKNLSEFFIIVLSFRAWHPFLDTTSQNWSSMWLSLLWLAAHVLRRTSFPGGFQVFFFL